MKRLFILILFTGIASSTQASAGTVAAPCDDNPASGLTGCQKYLIDGIPASNGVPFIPGVLPQLKQQVTNQIEGNAASTPAIQGYYDGVDPDVDAATIPHVFGPTLCNLTQSPFNPNPELTKNHRGADCGNPIHLDVVVKTKLTLSGIKLRSGYPKITIHKEWDSDPKKSMGTLEDGYMRGGLIQATSYYYQEVVNEIQSTHSVTPKAIGGVASACSAFADGFQTQTKLMKQNIDSFKTLVASQPNVKQNNDILNCRKGWDPLAGLPPGAANAVVDAGPLRQSAQQLCAARAAIEAMFVQLAACEIFARASTDYTQKVGSASGQSDVLNVLQNGIAKPCADQCKNDLDPSVTNIPSDSEVTNCANGCYKSRLPTEIQKYIKTLWPPQASNEPKFFPGLMIGMLGFVKSPRRRRSSKRGSSHLPLIIFLSIALLMVEAALSSGCGSESGAGATIRPPTNCQGMQTLDVGKCCPGGNVADIPACPNPDPGSKSVGRSLRAGATNASIAATNLGNASSLLGNADQSQQQTGGTFAQTNAATVDNGPIKSLAKGGGPSNTSSNTGNGTTQARRTGSGSGSASSGSSGAIGSGLKTDASSTEDGGAPTTASALGSDGTSTGYKAGGAGGDGSGSASGGFGSNRGIDVSGGSGGADSGFDSNAVSGAKAENGPDAEDYFTRAGLNDNLFKIVEKKYREKSLSWVNSDIAGFKKQGVAAPLLKP